MMRLTAVALSVLMALLLGGTVRAEGVGVMPVRVYIDAQHRVQTIVISNHDAVNHVFQVTPYRWTQVGGREVQTPTQDLIVAPPVFTLIPDSQQVVRVALRNPAPVAGELTYRLMLRMVGGAETAVSLSGLGIRMQFSVPIFIASPQGTSTKVDWRYRDIGPDKIQLIIANVGNTHIHLEHLSLNDARGVAFDDDVNQYVLGGNTVDLTLTTKRPLTADTVAARVTYDTGLSQQIVVHRGQ